MSKKFSVWLSSKRYLIAYTTLAARVVDLSLPKNSRAELSIPWKVEIFSLKNKKEKVEKG